MLEFELPQNVFFGPGRLAELGMLVARLAAKRVLVISDPGVVKAKHTGNGIASLENAGLTVALYDGVGENPTTDHVAAGLAIANAFQPDLLVGLGGGSAMDCAKGINFLFSCGGEMQDYWGRGKAIGPMLPFIAVPTTAGTGSESQSYALISDATTHKKMACGDKRAAAAFAILDPLLTRTQPQRVTALTGLDAIAHAIESFVTKPRNAISNKYSLEAFRLLAPNYIRVLDEPDNIDARSAMQLGAMFAGMAIENSMLGAAHALANPLTASCGIVHGEAVGLMLPHVIRFNTLRIGTLYKELATNAQLPSNDLAKFVENIRNKAGLAGRLSECGVQREQLPSLAKGAATEWTLQFNPCEMTMGDLLSLYELAW